MSLRLQIVTLCIGGFFSLLSLYLLVRKKNNERNTLLWLGGSLIVFVLSADPGILVTIARWLGVSYPPTLLFLLSSIVLLVIVLYQSIQISTLNSKVTELGQEFALANYSSPPRLMDPNLKPGTEVD